MRNDPSRRQVLKSGAVAGGLILTVGLPARAGDAAPAVPPSAFIRIDRDTGVTLIMPRVEMGEGTYTALSMLIAEELEIGLDQIRLEPAPPDAALYSDPINEEQVTGTSATIRAFYDPLRRAGAAARTMLIAAASLRWKVDAVTCHAERGAVIHGPSGRSLAYADLAADAAKLRPPRNPPLKDSKDFRLIGRAHKRVDAPDKVTGKAQFGIDTRLPGMRIATVAACPVFGGTLAGIDDAKAKQVAGVRQIVRLADAVAVVADHMGAAKKGLEALEITWNEGPGAKDDSAGIRRGMETESLKPGVIAVKTGDAGKALAGAATRIEAVYRLPLLAHATMEPMNCTAQVTKEGCDVWVGTQSPVRAQMAAAKAAGLPAAKVRIHNQLIGGGFGRRLYVDQVAQAVAIARQVEGPVKVIWTREEDIRHDHYRPCYLDRLQGGLDAHGNPVAWTHRVCASAVSLGWDPTSLVHGLDGDAIDAAFGPYAFPNVLIDYVRHEPGKVPTGWWRGVGPTHNTFMVEGFVDELAAAAARDPVEFRRALLGQTPRVRAVLDLAAAKAGWGATLPHGRGRGVSVLASFGSFLAQAAEVTVAADGTVRVDRVVCAVDCGQVVNPDTIRAQVEGGIIFGITAALYGEITLDRGRVVEGNFDTYRLLRIDEAPAIEVHIVDSIEAPGGIGEPPTATIMPAITNAIFAATGKRLRALPVDPALLKSKA